MYEALEHWNQYKQKQNELQQGPKYTQKPAEIPGGMRLEMMKDVEDKIITQQEYDQWLNKLIAKNGTTNY